MVNNTFYFFLGLYAKHDTIDYTSFQHQNMHIGLIENDPGGSFLKHTSLFEDNGLIEQCMDVTKGVAYSITPLGRELYEAETAKRQSAKEDAELDKKLKKAEYELKQSVIDTNKSVKDTNGFIQESTKTQNNLTKVSLAVAGASALFALGSVFATIYVASNETTSTELRRIDTQYQKQLQVLEKMQQSLQGIDSSMKKIDSVP